VSETPSILFTGPAMGRNGDQFIMAVPFRKSTVGSYSQEAIQTVVEVMLMDSLPIGLEADPEKPKSIVWSEQEMSQDHPSAADCQVIVQMTVFTRPY
jgi:hypothetical protein